MPRTKTAIKTRNRLRFSNISNEDRLFSLFSFVSKRTLVHNAEPYFKQSNGAKLCAEWSDTLEIKKRLQS